jgi:DNA-binding CsgD family transcriptional regulator
VLLGTYTLTNTFLRSFLGVEDKAFVLLGVCVAALAVLVLVFRCFNTFELKALYQVSVPLLVAGAMFVLVGIPGAGVAAALCSNAAFTLFSIFITTAFCAISFRYGVNALWLFGITQAALTAGSFVGAMLPWGESLLAMSDVGMTATVAVLVVLLAALSMLLVSDRDFETTWGVTPRKDSAGAVSALEEEEQESRRCAKVARRYGLTRREEEILLLLMRGYTLSHIASELYVAESTMKTHSRHIYRKVGVANRQELQELLRAYPV